MNTPELIEKGSAMVVGSGVWFGFLIFMAWLATMPFLFVFLESKSEDCREKVNERVKRDGERKNNDELGIKIGDKHADDNNTSDAGDNQRIYRGAFISNNCVFRLDLNLCFVRFHISLPNVIDLTGRSLGVEGRTDAAEALSVAPGSAMSDAANPRRNAAWQDSAHRRLLHNRETLRKRRLPSPITGSGWKVRQKNKDS